MSNNIIDSIQLSGTVYTIQGTGGGGSPTVELTQAEYDALVSAGTVSANTYYIITDAQEGDLTQYWTSAQTNSAINAAVSGKQDTLSAGTGIDITDNVISATGGGSSINVVQTTGSSTTDVMSQDAVTTQLNGTVTTDTEQTISGRKIFTYTASSGKAIEFKQTSDDAKVGFSIKNSASTNNEVASFEFRPNTFTIDSVQHPLMYFGHYRNTNTANAGVPQTVIGFRQYDQKNAAAYHYLIPLPEKAKTPFSLTTSFKDYYAPMGFKVDSGGTMVTTDNTGVVDLSSYLGGGGSITIDPTLDSGSTNPVANSAITNNTLSGGVESNNFFRSVRLWRNNGQVAFYKRFAAINGNSVMVDGTTEAPNFQLVETSAITTSISSSSTDSQVPSAKAVYDTIGNINTILESI